MTKNLILIISIFILAACSAQGSDSVTNPNPATQITPVADVSPALPTGDANLTRAEIFLDSSQVRTLESYPLQFNLNLTGNLPTPCHKLHVDVQDPDAQNQIQVEAYSMVDPEAMCVQVLQPFDVTVSLGSYPPGSYTVLLNGKMIAEIKVN